MEDYKNYKTWLQQVNSTNAPAQTEKEKQMQLESDMRIKGYITHAVKDDNILSKALGISLTGADKPSEKALYLANLYIEGKKELSEIQELIVKEYQK